MDEATRRKDVMSVLNMLQYQDVLKKNKDKMESSAPPILATIASPAGDASGTQSTPAQTLTASFDDIMKMGPISNKKNTVAGKPREETDEEIIARKKKEKEDEEKEKSHPPTLITGPF